MTRVQLNDSGNFVHDDGICPFEHKTFAPRRHYFLQLLPPLLLPYRGRFATPITANQCYCLLIKGIIAMFYDRVPDQLSKETEQNERDRGWWELLTSLADRRAKQGSENVPGNFLLVVAQFLITTFWLPNRINRMFALRLIGSLHAFFRRLWYSRLVVGRI